MSIYSCCDCSYYFVTLLQWHLNHLANHHKKQVHKWLDIDFRYMTRAHTHIMLSIYTERLCQSLTKLKSTFEKKQAHTLFSCFFCLISFRPENIIKKIKGVKNTQDRIKQLESGSVNIFSIEPPRDSFNNIHKNRT